MKVLIFILAAFVFQIVLAHHGRFAAEDPTVVGRVDGSPSPVDPAALEPAPAFGESGPLSVRDQKSTEETQADDESAKWHPKLQVVLVTQPGDAVNEQTSVHPNQLDPFSVAVERISPLNEQPTARAVILKCDDINVEAIASENGNLTYRFSCRGNAILKINENTVSGDSIDSSEGVLTISNAVVRIGELATLRAEKLQLTLPVFGVRIQAAQMEQQDTAEKLQPVPDAIGNAVSY